MGLFKRRRRTDAGAVVSDRDATRADLAALREFATTRTGVEAYVEPKTTVTQTTVVFVASDGEWTRRRIPNEKAAADLARSLKIPVYDANRVGYPQRMRDYNARASAKKTSVEVERGDYSPSQFGAIMTLETIAGTDPLPRNPSKSDLERVLRAARAQAHPDRTGGDRTRWDKVEQAARTLGL
ncbi:MULTISPECIES: hypothetical protein [Aeromicrobium]|uniref:hypothetical protein n=1 Tax=Aeromicrobium TaxID=2040 RepID=UPI001CA9BFF1|nr:MULTISPECIES: hypothetical protein [Aeromicrobium]